MSVPCPTCLPMDCTSVADEDDLYSLPSVTRQYKSNGASGNPVPDSKSSCSSFPAILSYFINFTPRKLVVRVLFCLPVFEYALTGCVLGIVLLCSKPQVIGINARPVVPSRAIVANAKSIRNISPVEYPRCDVRPNHGLESIKRRSTGDVAISLALAPRPNPTRFGFIDLFPKPFFKCDRKAVVFKNWIVVIFHSFSAEFIRGHKVGNYAMNS